MIPKVIKVPPPTCPQCKSTIGNLRNETFWCMDCGKYTNLKTGKAKDFNRGSYASKKSDNYDSENPVGIGYIPPVKEIK